MGRGEGRLTEVGMGVPVPSAGSCLVPTVTKESPEPGESDRAFRELPTPPSTDARGLSAASSPGAPNVQPDPFRAASSAGTVLREAAARGLARLSRAPPAWECRGTRDPQDSPKRVPPAPQPSPESAPAQPHVARGARLFARATAAASPPRCSPSSPLCLLGEGGRRRRPVP